MKQGKVYFIELAVSNKPKYTCDITEILCTLGKRVNIFTANDKDANFIDQLLWTFKQDSFIPHARTEFAEDEPVIIYSKPEIERSANALILFDPINRNEINGHELIIDFAETYDKKRLQDSRQRYKEFRDDENYQVEFLKLGAFLRKNF